MSQWLGARLSTRPWASFSANSKCQSKPAGLVWSTSASAVSAETAVVRAANNERLTSFRGAWYLGGRQPYSFVPAVQAKRPPFPNPLLGLFSWKAECIPGATSDHKDFQTDMCARFGSNGGFRIGSRLSLEGKWQLSLVALSLSSS